MSLTLYNTLTRTKEEFKPLIENFVRMYVCGPTVYGHSHIGHGKSYVSFDVIVRFLRYCGNKVLYVQNITDVGHLLGETNEGEDRILKQSKSEHKHPMEIAEFYTHSYFEDMDVLNVLRPDISPRATGHIIEQIEMIQAILDKGLAYEVNGSVYFDVKAYNAHHHYGALSGRVLEELQAGAGNQSRSLEGQDEKRNPNDFALWKRASVEHIMQWSSPWGKGFPGWHIECSAMSARYLGEYFDIHGGGMDLLFPHHECEIAQSSAAHNHTPAKYWVHHNMITINGQKMAKSLGNGIMVDELFSGKNPLLDQAYSPMTLRFFVLQAHYRGTLDFSNDALLAAQKGWNRLQSTFKLIEGLPTVNANATCVVDDLVSGIQESLNEDLNTPQAIAHLFELARRINVVNDGNDSITQETKLQMQSIVQDYCEGVLGMKFEDVTDNSGLTDAMSILLDLRGKAKADKNWALSDQIRDALKEKGFEIKDGKDGTTWNRF